MDQSTMTISNTLSKGTIFDPDVREPVEPGQTPVSISNEQIRKGNLVLHTYQVMADAIHGGMGSVWRVHHNSWDKDLAMKRPQPRFFAEGSERRKQAFIRECENWISLGLHPNVVSCYYVREIGGVPTVFSEWMEYGSLKDRIGDGSLYEGTEEAVSERLPDIAIQAARGLRYSHEHGLVHQDVKPGNLLLTKKWEAKAADFGLAQARRKLEEEASAEERQAEGSRAEGHQAEGYQAEGSRAEGSRAEGLQAEGYQAEGRQAADAGADPDAARSAGRAHFGGYTLAYCPKEQKEGSEPEPWMDIYAWALTVLEMYAGKRLWESGEQAKEVFSSVCAQCRIPLPPEMADLLERALNRSYASFDALLPELEEIYRKQTGSLYPRAEDKNATDTADILNNRALSWLDLGMPGEALEAWEQALRISPDHADSLFNRELFLVRSDREPDRDAVKVLDRYDPSGALSEPIRLECGGTYLEYEKEEEKRWKEVKTQGSASYYARSGGYYYLPVFAPPEEEREYLDPRDNGQSRLLGLKKVKLDGTDEEFLDPMEALVPLLGKGKKEIVIHPGTQMAAILQYHVLSLYDIRQRKLLVEQKLVLDGDTTSSVCFSQDGTQVILDVTLGRREKRYFTLILQVPSLEPVFEAEYRFVGFSKKGIYLRSEEELAHYTEETGIQTLFRFEAKVEKAYEYASGTDPLFLYRYENGEAFCLCGEAGSMNAAGSAGNNAGSAGKLQKIELSDTCFEGDEKILHYDARSRLLYRKRKETGIALWDLERQKRLCTFVTPNQFTPDWDSEDQVLIFSYTMNSYTEWWLMPLPERRADARNASWRLSGIITSDQRLEDDRRLEALAQEFRQCREQMDVGSAIRIHDACTKIEGFPSSAFADDMELWLDAHARRCSIYGAFPGTQTWEMPPVCGEHFEIVPLSDGSFAMAEQYIGDVGGVALFREDGSLIRFVRIEGSRYGDKPFFLSRVTVRGDRIYAFTHKLAYSVYDLEGNRIASSISVWPPVEKKEKREMPDPYDEEEMERRYREKAKEFNYEYYDMDSSGRYLLFSQMQRSGGEKNGTYQKDLITGETIRISVRCGLFTLGYYLEDDSVIFLQKGGVLERFTKDGTSICKWKVDCSGIDHEAVKLRVSPGRDRILVFVEAKNRAPGRTFVYDKDGMVLHRWEETQYVCQMMMDGRFLYEPGFVIRDSFTGEIAFKAPIPSVTKENWVGPDGRRVYIQAYDTTKVEAKGIVTEYRVRYHYEEIPPEQREKHAAAAAPAPVWLGGACWHFPSSEDVPGDLSHLIPVVKGSKVISFPGQPVEESSPRQEETKERHDRTEEERKPDRMKTEDPGPGTAPSGRKGVIKRIKDYFSRR